MIAPSGKFWMAMPTASASALIGVMFAVPASRPAYTTPTAMPSGTLWIVTARTIIVVRARRLRGPSASWLNWCRCGMAWSSNSRNRIPRQKPATDGTTAPRP